MKTWKAILLIPAGIILAWAIYVPVKILLLPLEWMLHDLKKLKV